MAIRQNGKSRKSDSFDKKIIRKQRFRRPVGQRNQRASEHCRKRGFFVPEALSVARFKPQASADQNLGLRSVAASRPGLPPATADYSWYSAKTRRQTR